MVFLEKHSQSRTTGSHGAEGVEKFFAHRALVEEYITNLTFSEDPQLSTLIHAMHHSLLAGGKRVRPMLCMEVARSFGTDPAEVLPTAAAIELIHTFSLIHDDLPAMDDDDYRRGMPTCHKEYGEATAILAGDAFFGESLALITLHQRGTPEQLLEVVRELAHSTGVGGMVGGQIIDIAHTGQETDADTLSTMHNYKTGALIRASARIGSILSGATSGEQEAISRYAHRLGLCFQIVDDILDTTSTTETLGKEAGGDVESGKATFVSLYGIEKSRSLADDAMQEALEALKAVDADIEGLAGIARFVRSRDN